MISLIIFALGLIVTISLGVFTTSTYPDCTTLLIIVSAVIFQLLINGLFAILTCKIMPDSFFDERKKIFSPSKAEIRFYKSLGIRKWKDKTLELGILNGFRKNKLYHPDQPQYYSKFILECNKGFLGHFFGVFVGTGVIFALPPSLITPVGIPIVITNFLINYLSICILRHNIPRLQCARLFSQRNNNAK